MTTQQNDTYFAVLDELRDLTLRKRAGYSPGDDPFQNFRMTEMFKVPCKCGCGVATPIPPIFGIMIREMDKMSRLASLLADPSNEQVGESIRDTMMDAGNYPLIGVAMSDADKAAAFKSRVDEITAEIDERRRKNAVAAAMDEADTMDRTRFEADPEEVCKWHGLPLDEKGQCPFIPEQGKSITVSDEPDSTPPGCECNFCVSMREDPAPTQTTLFDEPFDSSDMDDPEEDVMEGFCCSDDCMSCKATDYLCDACVPGCPAHA